MPYQRRKRNNKPLHPRQFQMYYFMVGTSQEAEDLMRHGVPANPAGTVETPAQKANQQRPYGAYGTDSYTEAKGALKSGKHLIETNIPENWVQSSYGGDTYSPYNIPPSFITRHIPPSEGN